MTTIEVTNTFSRINELDEPKIVRELRNTLSFLVPGYQFSKAFKRGMWDKSQQRLVYWDGRKYLITKNLRFPTGLLFEVENILIKHKHKYVIDDKRTKVELGNPIPVKTINPYGYQKRILERALQEEGGVIQVATGGGKSAICCMIAGMLNTKTLIYVHTKDLLYQMKRNVEKYLGVECGQIGDGIIDLRQINVATVQTAYRAYGKKYSGHIEDGRFSESLDITKHKKQIINAIESANVIFFDECHRLISDTFQLISNKSKAARYRFALSATAFRDDDCDILVSAACGKKIAGINASYLIENNYLVKPTIYMSKVPRAKRHYRDYHKAYDDYIVENDERNAIICKAADMAISKGRKVLILIQKLKHGEILYDLLKERHNVAYLQGKNDSWERQMAVDAIKLGDLDCIIASTIFDEGVDIPILDTVILAGGGKSKVRAMQRIGRVLRTYPGKKSAYVVDFIDSATYLLKHSKERMAMYETEPLFQIKKQK